MQTTYANAYNYLKATDMNTTNMNGADNVTYEI